MAYGAAAIVTLFVLVFMLIVFAWVYLTMYIADMDFKGAEAVAFALFISPYLVGGYFMIAYMLGG